MGRRLLSRGLKKIKNYIVFHINLVLIKGYDLYIKHLESKIVKLNMKRILLHSRFSDAVLVVELNNVYGNEDSNKKLVNDCFHTMSDVNIKQRMIRESISKINNTISRINTNKYRLINNNRIIKP